MIENTTSMSSGGRAATRGRGKSGTRGQSKRTKAARERLGVPLLWLAAVRIVASIVAIPAAAALFRKHFVVLVLLRPTKEVLLAAGFALRSHKVSLVPLLIAAIPLLVLGVWHFYVLGRLYGTDLKDLPGWAKRIMPPDRIDAMCKVLAKRGTPVVFFGRLAAFPSAVVAAAAGASKLPTKKFLLADGGGALLSFVVMVGAGYALGEAYDAAGPWLTAVGVVTLIALAVLMGRWLRKV